MPDAQSPCRRSSDPVRVDRLGRVEYQQAWDTQRRNATARREGTGPDVLMLLEHPPVYTAGRRTQPEDRPTDGTPVVDVDRGGRITWHGPGQLVGYPIVALSEPMDVVDYVRRLEEALITVVDGLGITGAGRVDGRSGVWLPAGPGRPERKVAAIGVRVQGGVTQHGFSLNANPDLGDFGRIVPCGIADAGVSSLSAELGRDVGVDEVLDVVTASVLDALDGRLPVRPHEVARPQAPAAAGLDLQLHPSLR
ncbi:lipoyl(octanoyl) transferase LipB [Pseudonocardia sp. KRD291]|uniref:lipoyl(octanoyl) transferase LipB n=1 Tax=Pseudonocardia sp. KRD291 TaxID=2792007 RepID=UPI001C4A3CEA|nr:lipoyl(octanoyl) transferase LipB [Pseudonocardia sp. KRD291]MBW0104827.1 lipoyl(octanoyl) transferase LipB [Pseudonocardia sp. KRD291]